MKNPIIYNIINIPEGLRNPVSLPEGLKDDKKSEKGKRKRRKKARNQERYSQYNSIRQTQTPPSYAEYGLSRFNSGGNVQDDYLKSLLLLNASKQQQQPPNNNMIEDLRNEFQEYQERNNANFTNAGKLLLNLTDRFDKTEKSYNYFDSAGSFASSKSDESFIPQVDVETNEEFRPQNTLTENFRNFGWRKQSSSKLITDEQRRFSQPRNPQLERNNTPQPQNLSDFFANPFDKKEEEEVDEEILKEEQQKEEQQDEEKQDEEKQDEEEQDEEEQDEEKQDEEKIGNQGFQDIYGNDEEEEIPKEEIPKEEIPKKEKDKPMNNFVDGGGGGGGGDAGDAGEEELTVKIKRGRPTEEDRRKKDNELEKKLFEEYKFLGGPKRNIGLALLKIDVPKLRKERKALEREFLNLEGEESELEGLTSTRLKNRIEKMKEEERKKLKKQLVENMESVTPTKGKGKKK